MSTRHLQLVLPGTEYLQVDPFLKALDLIEEARAKALANRDWLYAQGMEHALNIALNIFEALEPNHDEAP